MRRAGAWSWIGVLVGLALGVAGGTHLARSNELTTRKLWEDVLEPVVRLTEQIETRYVQDVDYDKLRVGAYEGALSELDRHSVYLPPASLKEFRDEIGGEFGGLGVRISYNYAKRAVQVEETLPGTPAAGKGLLPGDLIVEIREEPDAEPISTADFRSIHDAVRVLRGKVGDPVTITVVGADGGKKRQITITRAPIVLHSVQNVRLFERNGRKLGYIKLGYFSKNAVKDLTDAVEYLRKKNAEALILDLRFNPGGLLEAARDCTSLFLDGKVIVSTRDREGNTHELYADPGRIQGDMPMAVLVNGYSASGSEIVSAALQHHRVAIVVGQTTYGKASVQKIIESPFDDGAIKLTIARYYTPGGKLIEGKGVKPDVEVELTDEQTRKLFAYLNEHIQYQPIPPEGSEPAERAAVPQKPSAPARPGQSEEPEKPFVDLQLQAAADVLCEKLAGAVTAGKGA